jgi:hypothetical protein
MSCCSWLCPSNSSDVANYSGVMKVEGSFETGRNLENITGFSLPSTEGPVKFVKSREGAVISEEYRASHAGFGILPAVPMATAIVCNEEQRANLERVKREPIAFSGSIEMALNTISTNASYEKVGLSFQGMLEGLSALFVKYEIPMGLLNKLMLLSPYSENNPDGLHAMEFLVDDSYSMRAGTSGNTRFDEAKSGLKEMVEVLGHIPSPRIEIRFLNRKDKVELKRRGETPEIFIERAFQEIDAAFTALPDGSTPAKERLEESFAAHPGERRARYFFCDGVPNGQDTAVEAIGNLLKNRRNPKGNPFTFFSCSDRLEDTEWMRTVEELADYCSEMDDYLAEFTEVLGDQGKKFPYNKGLYLIAKLVGAMDPCVLDAMDESVPFTKKTFDSITGYITSEADYRSYFDGFIEAQRERLRGLEKNPEQKVGESDFRYAKHQKRNEVDQIKATWNWGTLFYAFLECDLNLDIPQVSEFRARLGKGNPLGYTPPEADLKEIRLDSVDNI